MVVELVMIRSRGISVLGLIGVTAGCGLASAAPATAGGIGDFLSPAFGISCVNENTGARADGVTRQGTGTMGGNLAGIPVGSALNQCGGADAPIIQDALREPCNALPFSGVQNLVSLVNIGRQGLSIVQPCT
jgi:ammonia channel protein AmtB